MFCNPILSVAAAAWFIGPFLVLCLLLREYFKPVDQKWRLFNRVVYTLPDGPSGQPVVGNLLQFMNARKTGKMGPWIGQMGKYGEMTTLHMGSKTWVLLNTKEAAEDIINKNGRVTTERPSMPIASGLVSHGKRTVLRQTKDWTEGRRVMHHLLSGSVLRNYGTWQEDVSLQLLSSYLNEPKRWYAHHYRYSAAVLYRVVMGEDLDEKTQDELDAFQFIGIEFVRILFSSVIEFFPALDNLPHFLQPWRSYWKNMGDHHRSVMVDWWTPIYQRVQDRTAKPSFVRDTLLHPDTKYKRDEEEAMYLAISVITAGGDNTRMSLNTIVMCLISNPDCLLKARAELDTVCGGKQGLRLPRLQDMDNLPYCLAIIKEALRWRPTVPLVPPHELTEDLHYKNYVFPKGVNFVINNIAIGGAFPDGDKFMPERWIDGTQSNVIHNHWGFGGGRRVCVGYRVAQQALFIAIARLIFCFDISAAGEYDSRILNHTSLEEPFPVKMSIRGPAYEDLIKKELVRAAKESTATSK